ncbi:MAG: MFS transporter [Petrimonas sp.]|jgi:fucose permease|uniref:L-fucose-proton symporter n=1 Tax=bioreactor metagenome TaxID=1076179 RepID=A0A644WZ31_9ZZZZ|nr:MFS transporter [Petrimonas sp.]BBD45483.1 N-acetyl glucosamine transporter, NagP [Petrimonas sp. IBARAKI]HCB89569.1 glucose/galactose MFS transporter [Porphyromonadaceae bacterium]MDD4015773.1 MFS transporter [Petrimonas sp.]MDD4845719.1 MFS transporter [Petrimonas sp.]
MKVDKKNIIVPLLLVGSMNAILGFALGVNAFFIPFVKQAFHVTTAMSYLIMLATFSAYLVFGGVAGNILKKAGYKGGMVIALILMAVGFLIIVPSAKTVNFSLFLLALFINGLGQALLTGAYSTYVSIIGSPESAASRISFMGICAKIFYAAASFILAVFMDLSNVRITDIITPFYIIAAVMSVMGIIYYFSPLPEVKAIGEETETGEIQNSYSSTKTSVWQFPHLLLGVVAIFFTVGVEYLALGTINDYANILGLSSPHNYVWFVSFAMIVGYLVGMIFIPKYISQTQALLASTILGIIVSITILILPSTISIYLIPLLGLANALLWPAIWPLAIADLGKFTKSGSALLVTGIVGAGIIPLIFGYFAQHFSYQMAYAIGLPAYLFIMYYALWGSKIRTKQA